VEKRKGELTFLSISPPARLLVDGHRGPGNQGKGRTFSSFCQATGTTLRLVLFPPSLLPFLTTPHSPKLTNRRTRKRKEEGGGKVPFPLSLPFFSCDYRPPCRVALLLLPELGVGRETCKQGGRGKEGEEKGGRIYNYLLPYVILSSLPFHVRHDVGDAPIDGEKKEEEKERQSPPVPAVMLFPTWPAGHLAPRPFSAPDSGRERERRGRGGKRGKSLCFFRSSLFCPNTGPRAASPG